MCQSFTLIDLTSQHHAVKHYVQGWTKSEILNWLANYGTIDEDLSLGTEKFLFRYPLNLCANFYFNENNKFEVANTKWLPLI